MGGQIALLKNPDTLINYLLPHLSYCKTLNDAPLVKTAMCSTSNEGHFVVKFFMEGIENSDQSQITSIKQKNEELRKMKEIQDKLDLIKNPNFLALTPQLIEKNQQSFLVAQRQFVYFSLLQKSRNKIPKLTVIEKKWLIFQLLCAVTQIHNQDIIHGDIKPENILITSSNQLFLTDLVCYKPAYIDSEDTKSYNLYFGELENNSRCYFAPERFCDSDFNQSLRDNKNLKKSMDIFSVACVISEIMMDGIALFNRGGLIKYKTSNNQQDIKQTLKKKINDAILVDLIMKMLSLKENERPSILECLAILFQERVLPNSFQQQFFQLNSIFVLPEYLFSDLKISLFRKYMPCIWKLCFPKNEFPKFLEPIEGEIYQKIVEDRIIERSYSWIPSNQLYENSKFNQLKLFDFLELSSCYNKNQQIFKIGQLDEKNIQNNMHLNDERDSAIILIHWIGTFLQTCFYPQSRRCALEMLMLIGRESSLQVRLQIILPYILKNFEDKQPKVQAKAIEAAVLIFENLVYPNESQNQEKYTLSSMDYRVFNSFIMPQFKILMEKKQYKDIQIVQLTLSKYLPLLSKIGHRFTELSVASRLQRKYHQQFNTLEDKKIRNYENDVQPEDEDESSENENEENYAFQRKNNILLNKKNLQDHDNTEAQVNFDQDIDILRKEFIKIISEFANSHDSSIKRILFSKIGQQCDFFGSKITMDSLIPHLLTCANEKEFKIKIDSLKSVVSIGIKVGKQTFTQFILPVFQTFLNEDELVVLEFIRTLSSITKMNLLQKSTLFSDYQINKQNQSDQLSLLDQMLPLLLHPNSWIREETLNFIKSLFDLKNSQILNKTEVFCLLRNKLVPYFNDRSSVFYLMDENRKTEDLLNYLKAPLSRSTFEMYIEAENRNYDHQDEFKHSQNDSYAIKIMNEYLRLMKLQNQKKSLMNNDNKKLVLGQKPKNDFWKQCRAYNLYRVIKVSTLEQLLISQKDLELKDIKKDQDRLVETNVQKELKANQLNINNNNLNSPFYSDRYKIEANSQVQNKIILDYTNQFFEPCKKADEIQSFQTGQSEIDNIMQALNLFPEDEQIQVSEQINNNLFSTISNQSLPLNWKLQLEKIEYQCAQPSEIPQFHPQYSRTTSIQVEYNEQRDKLGDQRNGVEKFRPKGRLITTLHEHSSPVTSVAVTQNQQMFITASREDGNIHVWSSSDILKDPTAHSRLSINANCKINKVCSISNSQLFCLTGSDSTLQIYDLNRLSLQRQNQEIKKNESLPNYKLPNKSEIIQQITNVDEIHKEEGEMMTCLNTVLPISHQHLITYSSQKGSFFMHDIRCNKPFLKQSNIFSKQKGMITCMSLGQDPYQILCGSIGGYISIYDIRFNLISSQFKHSSKYPILSLAAFKPQDKLEFPSFSQNLNISKNYNKSQFFSPMALVSLGGPSFEVSLLNLDTGDIEIMMTVNEPNNSLNQNNQIGITVPSFYRDSLIRDSYSWPEKAENNQSLFKRLKMQTKSMISSQQIKLNKNIDDELYKGSKLLYKLLKESSQSQNACRKILIPRRYSSLLQSTQTVDYALLGGNDMRIRYFNLTDPCNLSYYINTPNNDECQHLSSQLAGGIHYIKEQISKFKNFPRVNENMFSENQSNQKQRNKLVIPDSPIELADDSIYYNVLQDMILQNSQYSQEKEGLKSCIGVKNLLGQSSLNDINMNTANKYQLEIENEKVTVFNYNGLSEWQHFNGINLYEGNSSLINSSYNDKWGGSNKSNQGSNYVGSKVGKNENYQDSYQQYRQGDGAPDNYEKYNESIRDYVYKESTNTSHSDAILDMEILEFLQQNQNFQNKNGETQYYSNSPFLITCSRDSTVKLWQ